MTPALCHVDSGQWSSPWCWGGGPGGYKHALCHDTAQSHLCISVIMVSVSLIISKKQVTSKCLVTWNNDLGLSMSCSSPVLSLSSHWSSGQFSPSPHTPRRFPRVRASAMTSRLTRGCLTTTTGRWRNLRPASTMVRRRTVMGAWWPGSTGSSSLMVEHRLSGQKKY